MVTGCVSGMSLSTRMAPPYVIIITTSVCTRLWEQTLMSCSIFSAAVNTYVSLLTFAMLTHIVQTHETAKRSVTCCGHQCPVSAFSCPPVLLLQLPVTPLVCAVGCHGAYWSNYRVVRYCLLAIHLFIFFLIERRHRLCVCELTVYVCSRFCVCMRVGMYLRVTRKTHVQGWGCQMESRVRW